MYRIMGAYGTTTEEIDEAETLEEANRLVAEYRMAYGEGWAIWIEVRTNNTQEL